MTKTPKKLQTLLISLAASVLLLASTTSQAAVLDFNYNANQITTSDPFGNDALLPSGSLSQSISQGYGDVTGQLNVSYRYIDASNQHVASLLTWPTGYDDLPYAAWNGNQSGGDRAQVELASINGSLVTLNSFRLGSWGTSGRQETVKVFELGNPAAVFEFTGLIGVNNLSNLFNINKNSTNGFLIEWTNPWWTGISKIDHNVSAVPVPAAMWLFASALAGFIGTRRRA